jgi:adenylosuccinate synthase
MAAKKKAAKAGAGAFAAGKAARDNTYVQKLIEDEGLRDDLRTAYDSARKAYSRLNGKGPAKALDDKKVQKELKETANSLKSAAETLRGPVKKRRKRKSLVGIIIIGSLVALVASEGLRKKALDALFGAEEEFEYTSTTTPSQTSGSTSQKEPAGA